MLLLLSLVVFLVRFMRLSMLLTNVRRLVSPTLFWVTLIRRLRLTLLRMRMRVGPRLIVRLILLVLVVYR